MDVQALRDLGLNSKIFLNQEWDEVLIFHLGRISASNNAN